MRKNKDSEGLKTKLGRVLEIPSEIVKNVPLVTLRGNSEAVIENYSGIIEYTAEKIRLGTGIGVLRLTGENMVIKCLDSETAVITGRINQTEFL